MLFYACIVDCTQVMSSNNMTMFINPRRNIKCPVCREVTRAHDVSFVSSGSGGDNTQEVINMEVQVCILYSLFPACEDIFFFKYSNMHILKEQFTSFMTHIILG